MADKKDHVHDQIKPPPHVETPADREYNKAVDKYNSDPKPGKPFFPPEPKK